MGQSCENALEEKKMTQAINRLQSVIPGFEHLPHSMQIEFIHRIPKDSPIYTWMNYSEPAHYYQLNTFALRYNLNQQKWSHKEILQRLQQHPMYKEVIEYIKQTQTIKRLENIIPEFDLLSPQLKQKFIHRIPKNSLLYAWLYPSVPENHYSGENFGLRHASKSRHFPKNQLLENIQQHPMYPKIRLYIDIVRLRNKGIPIVCLSKEDVQYLIQGKFYESENFENILYGKQPQMRMIREKIKNYFNQELAILFKTNDLRFFMDTYLQLSKEHRSKRNALLIRLLKIDWEIYFDLTGSLKPIQKVLLKKLNSYSEPIYQYFEEMQSAHLFYRFFGISSDHMVLGTNAENPWLPFVNIFDYSMYHKNRKTIHDAMNVWNALFKPLKPFFHEYVEMAQTEKNLFAMMFRALMPFLIMSLVLSLGYAAVLPLAYHQLIEYIFFIPAFYFSIVIASQYIQIKNYLYLQFVQLYYGSIYKTAYFQADETLVRTFQSKELADQVAEYYTSGLEQCDKIEKAYQNYHLNTQHIDARQDNIKLKTELSKEWRDFKTSSISIEKIAKTFADRLQKDKNFCRSRIKELISIYFDVKDNKKAQVKGEFQVIKSRLCLIDELRNKMSKLDFQDASLKEQYENHNIAFNL